MSGKGSRPRPYSVDKDKFNAEFDRIFGKKDEKERDIDKPTTKKRSRPRIDKGGLL